VPRDASGKYVIQITFDLGPIGGKVVGRKEINAAK
jgi:hypothetical protein